MAILTIPMVPYRTASQQPYGTLDSMRMHIAFQNISMQRWDILILHAELHLTNTRKRRQARTARKHFTAELQRRSSDLDTIKQCNGAFWKSGITIDTRIHLSGPQIASRKLLSNLGDILKHWRIRKSRNTLDGLGMTYEYLSPLMGPSEQELTVMTYIGL